MENDLQFERAEFEGGADMACTSCKAGLATEYFALGQQTLCRDCTDRFRTMLAGQGSAAARFGVAVALGTGAALLGGAVYAAVMILADSEWAR